MRDCDTGSLELLIQGQTRGLASAYQRSTTVITALAIPDSSSDMDRSEAEKALKRIDHLLSKLRWTLQRGFENEFLIDVIRREELTTASDVADFVTFLLSLTNRISLADQQMFLNTFSVRARLNCLEHWLRIGDEDRQFGVLLKNRVRRFTAGQFTALMEQQALFVIADRKGIDSIETTHILSNLLNRPIKSEEDKLAAWLNPEIRQRISEVLNEPEAGKEIRNTARMALIRREGHIVQHIAEGVDILISSLYLQSGGLIQRELGRYFEEVVDRSELRKNRDENMRPLQAWVSQTLRIREGRETGSRNKPKRSDEVEATVKKREREIVQALCELLKQHGEDDKLTIKGISTEMKRSRSTLYQWFAEGIDFERMKDIALIMYSDRRAFLAWQRTGREFDKMPHLRFLDF